MVDEPAAAVLPPVPSRGDVGGLDGAGTLAALRSVAAAEARLSAVRIELQAHFAALNPPTEDDNRGLPYSDFTADELAIELSLSPGTARKQLRTACSIVRRLPATLDALESGLIDQRRAYATDELTAYLTAEQAARVEETALAQGGQPSHQFYRRAVRRAVLEIDPTGAEKRHERARAERAVWIQPSDADDGMAQLRALIPADTALAAFRRIDQFAHDTTDPDDPRGIDERRADVFADLLLGTDFPGARAEIHVRVSADTLLGISDEPGELEGYGPITAAMARRLAAGSQSTWRRILTNAADGTILDAGRQRFPPPGLARHIRARDRNCVFPGCPQPADKAQIDHTQPHSEDGDTVHSNLGVLCPAHHAMKHRDNWELTQPSPGHFHWKTPSGNKHTVISGAGP